MSILIFSLILIALILVHELGHFVVAKLAKIKVEEFSIFFPPRLFSFKKGETLYSFNALPLGGYVKIFGENHNEHAGDPRSFASKPRYVQAAVVVAGVVMNLLFAWVALSFGYMNGLPTSTHQGTLGQVTLPEVTIVGVVPGSPAAGAGLMPGDKVEVIETGTARLAVETLSTNEQAQAVQNFIAAHQDESLVLTVVRGGEEKAFLAKAEEGIVEGRKALGIQLDDIGVLQLPPHLAFVEGARLTYYMTIETARGLAHFVSTIVRGVADFSSVAGPVGIIGLGANAVEGGFAAAATLTALISINLAIFNLLPIPGLDGLRLVIIGIEGVIRRQISPRITTALTVAGMALLITLMVIVSISDIAKLVG